MFKLNATIIPGCFEIQPVVLADDRGRFVKVFHAEAFADLGLRTDFVEEYYSVSRHGVIRGLHFQSPPMDHDKVVFCVAGRVQDAVLDLRRGSPGFGHFHLLELTADRANMLYIPRGVAHGFCTLSDHATLVYKVSSLYSPMHDEGIRWDSAGIPWAVSKPVLSDRDLSHPPFECYRTPFAYHDNDRSSLNTEGLLGKSGGREPS